MIQGDSAWLEARAGKITASRAADLMATLKTGKPAQAYTNLIWDLAVERMTGKKMESFQSSWMARGIELEPEAREAYEDRKLIAVEEVPLVIHPEYDFVSCSPDGLVDDDGLVEIKCLTAANHGKALLHGQHAKDYRMQVQFQMWVTARLWSDVVAYHPEYPQSLSLAIVRVERDEETISEIEAKCMEAHQEIDAIVESLREAA